MSDDIKKAHELIQKNLGYLTFSQSREEGISYSAISKLIKDGDLVSEERGFYRLPNVYIDEYVILQHRYPKGIFSLESALLLHGLSQTIPFEPTMSFPYGTNTKLIKASGVKPVILRSNYSDGIVCVETPGSQIVMAYEAERTLVECLRPIYKTDVQIIAPAFKLYSQNRKIDFSKLFHYAKIFKVENKVQSYMEVLEFSGIL